jgi:hypothetical protein
LTSPKGHRAGLDAKDLAQLLGRAEGQPARRAERLVQALQVDPRLGMRDDEEDAALLVLEEQVLRVKARDFLLDRLRLGDREHRHMLVGPRRDAEALEQGEEVGGRRGQRIGLRQAGLLAGRPRRLKAAGSAGRAPCKTASSEAHEAPRNGASAPRSAGVAQG